MNRPPSRPLRRALAVVGIGGALAWWGFRAGSESPPPPPVLAAPGAVTFAGLPQRGGDVRLVVRTEDASGAPLADVVVTLVSDARVSYARTGEDGTCELEGLVAGHHRIAALPLDRPPKEVDATLPLEGALAIVLGEPWTDLAALEPSSHRDLTGRVAFPFDASPEGYELAFLPLWPGAGPPPLDDTMERRVTLDAQGRYALAELAVGSYDVVLLPPWAAGGDWPALARQQHLHTSGEGPAELVLSARHGEITGNLVDLDGLPVAGALVELVDTTRPTRLFPHELSSPEGRFRFPAVPAGTWRLRVRAGDASFERLVRVNPLRSERVDIPPLALRR